MIGVAFLQCRVACQELSICNAKRGSLDRPIALLLKRVETLESISFFDIPDPQAAFAISEFARSFRECERRFAEGVAAEPRDIGECFDLIHENALAGEGLVRECLKRRKTDLLPVEVQLSDGSWIVAISVHTSGLVVPRESPTPVSAV